MPSRDELKELARTRMKEARALYANGLYDGSRYLAGYVVELALKARICKALDLPDYPEKGELGRLFKIHKLEDLVLLAGLKRKFDEARARDPNLLAAWSVVTTWSETLRYEPVGTSAQVRAEEYLAALEDRTSGVFTWLKKHW